MIKLEVDLPSGDKENLVIYEDDNLEDIVEIFSYNHRKHFVSIINIELDKPTSSKLLEMIKDCTFDSYLVEGKQS